MTAEQALVQFVTDTSFENLPDEPVAVAKKIVLADLGAIIAGAAEEGCAIVVDQVKDWGGRPEATILVYGGRVPAHNAAFANTVMARALDFDDGMEPGIHIGASAVPTALALSELVGGCSGKDFLSALVLGAEVAARLVGATKANLVHRGFDPTGICTIFASAAVAGRLLRLNRDQMLHALALAFNRAGGSFQSNIDGSLAVRFIQGFTSEAGVLCARLAKEGITGPRNFLEGVFGFYALYAGEDCDREIVTRELGRNFRMTQDMFKRFPNCGSTMASTDAAYRLVHEKGLKAEDVARIDITVTQPTYDLVGKPFEIGDNPRVDGQFNIAYCVANVLLRKDSRLEHFVPSAVTDPRIMPLARKVHITADPALEKRGLLAMDMTATTRSGAVQRLSVDVPHGFPGDPLTPAEHLKRFQHCLDYARRPPAKQNAEQVVSSVERLEELEDVRSLIPLLLGAA
jgi:2-methylcitrate dehydratase PrpD